MPNTTWLDQLAERDARIAELEARLRRGEWAFYLVIFHGVVIASILFEMFLAGNVFGGRPQ